MSPRLGQILKRKLSNYTSNRHSGSASEWGLSLGFQRCWQLAVALFNWQSVQHPTQVQWRGGRWAPAPSAQVSGCVGRPPSLSLPALPCQLVTPGLGKEQAGLLLSWVARGVCLGSLPGPTRLGFDSKQQGLIVEAGPSHSRIPLPPNQVSHQAASGAAYKPLSCLSCQAASP